MYKISIVVPVYNTKLYLNRCVDSILGIERCDIEVLLIDDGSNDGSSEICNSYSNDSRVKIIHKLNEGIAATRNLALDIAKGEYIYFCDADDYVEPEIFNSIDLNGSDMHVFGYIQETIVKDCVHKEEFNCDNIILDRDNIKKCLNMDTKIIYPLWNKVLKKSIIDDNKIRFENISCWEDAIFIMDYLRYARSIQFHSEFAYHYQVISGTESLSKQKFVADRKSQYLLLYHRRCITCTALGVLDNEMKNADGRGTLIYNIVGDMVNITTFAALKKNYVEYKKYYTDLFNLQEVKNAFKNKPKLKNTEAKLGFFVIKLFYLFGNCRLFIWFEKSINKVKRILKKREHYE